jgi:DNA-binding NarL/FixJ family response regulator
MIRLAIIEDNATYRTVLELYIRKQNDIEIVYIDSSVKNLVSNNLIDPHVVIMDINLGSESGIESLEKVRAMFPEAGVFMLTGFDDEEMIFKSIKAGALGYLLKTDAPEKIVEAIRNINKGESAINGQVARKLINHFSSQKEPKASFEAYHLTKREHEILVLLLDGLSYKEIAAKCFISIDTLNSHIRKVYTKLNVHSRSEIAAKFR